MSEPKFKVGDLVRHRASGRLGVVVCDLSGRGLSGRGLSGCTHNEYEISCDLADICNASEVELEPATSESPQPIYGVKPGSIRTIPNDCTWMPFYSGKNHVIAGEKIEQGDAIYWDISEDGFVAMKLNC